LWPIIPLWDGRVNGPDRPLFAARKRRRLMTTRVLIVDDDPTQRRILEEIVRRGGYEPVLAEDGEQAVGKIRGAAPGEIDAMVLDLVMPGLDGMGVLESIRPDTASLPVIVQTAQGGIDTVVSAMRAGATDFVVKPVSPERLEVSIKNALKVTALQGEIGRIQRKIEGTFTFADIITRSPEMARVVHLGERAAASNIPIIIEGESGVGKEMIARAIQGSSARRGKPFITVNCGAIPANLVESILFGHEKGAFTGASDKHMGKFAEASGGTLFLDEVGELPLDMQVKLLRALQEGEIDPVGSKRPVKVDIRIISATNRNMMELVREGKFREDLYYRLNVFPIHVPALRARLEDVPLLAQHFATRFAAEEHKPIDGIDPQALSLLQRYDWPGNVRQLENTVFRAVVLADKGMLTASEFPQIAAQLGEPFELSAPPPPLPQAAQYNANYMQPGTAGLLPTGGLGAMSAFEDPTAAIRAVDDSGQMRPLEEIEADIIKLAIDHYAGHMSEVARRLKIGRSTLYRKVRELGIEGIQ